ncbi:hypothetical protein GCM10025876_40590 [Demequina litorisediminis]|uniref:Ribbon-helix-helix protein CopG domain-containing protein n=1 Tax=Demequina litorisediminis TaxID=1849022 RepID=A0ABQ6IIW4_9MICO|nr:hypothetical protein GCM10025876_40000 [Demequina litorisediminis]GMA37855.1 hypothetical protein GCM10025876_40590 [Demequina litorisediminis]
MRDTIAQVVGAAAPIFDTPIRHLESAAVDARRHGRLVHELEDAVSEDRSARLAALRAGEKPGEGLFVSNATSLANDYQDFTRELLKRIAEPRKQGDPRMSPERQAPQRASLEGAFSGKDRGQALSGLLTPKAPQPADAATPAPSEPVPVKPSAEPKQAKPATTPKKAATPVSQSVDNETIVNVGIYLEPDLLERLTAIRKERDTTYADLLVEAFDAVDVESLTEHFAGTTAPSLVPGQMPRAVKVKRSGSGIQRQFRLTVAQRDYLDAIADKVGAPSRSALAATVLAKHVDRT